MNSTSYTVAYTYTYTACGRKYCRTFDSTSYLKCKLRTHIVIHEFFLLYFIPKIVDMLEKAEGTMFYEKCFRLIKKSNASEFATAFQKFNRFLFQLPHP